MSLREKISNAWNAFRDNDKPPKIRGDTEDPTIFYNSSFSRNDRYRMRFGNDRTIINSIYSRIANDVASVTIEHVRVDENDRFIETINSGLNECMTLSANIDQTSRDFWVDTVLSMLDEGVVAVVPVDTDVDIRNNNSYDILSLRTGRITQWYPSSVRVEVYNDRSGKKEELTLPKNKIGILENPFYAVMNEPNSTLKRLIYKLNLLDQVDSQKATSKMNLLFQLPYSLKSKTRVEQAEKRRTILEDQLENSRYGIAYIDSTEKVTQLSRPIDNDLLTQIDSLTDKLYAQLGIGKEVFEGKANQEQMLWYNNKVIEPILTVIQLEFTRKFLTPTARTQGQKIQYHVDPFRLVPVAQLADIADKFTRNEIVSSNEFRATIGFKASNDPRADELINKNMPIDQVRPMDNQNGSLDQPLGNDVGSEEDISETEAELDSLEDDINSDDLDSLEDDVASDEFSETEALLDEIEKILDEDE